MAAGAGGKVTKGVCKVSTAVHTPTGCTALDSEGLCRSKCQKKWDGEDGHSSHDDRPSCDGRTSYDNDNTAS